MGKAKVYYSDLRALPGTNLLIKLRKLIKAAGIEAIDFEKKYAAVKIHFGEPGNLAFLRPNYAKVVVDIVKELGGKPFLTDCNTLYVGRRKDALEHLEAAYENGFSPFSCGCHLIIADGLKGTDEADVEVKGGELVQTAKIGRAIMDADILISLSHFKGHELTGFGGTLKNIGMGSGSRAGKMHMHSDSKPRVQKEACVGCGVCVRYCAQEAIRVTDKKAVIDSTRCVGCGRCLAVCSYNAIYSPEDSANDALNRKIAEYSKAVLDGRPHFHISLVIDVSPYCDCHAENDVAIIPDVGMFASFDPVALDQACADACNAQPVMPGSLLHDNLQAKGACGCDENCAGSCGADCNCKDHFTNTSPVTDWTSCLEHAEKIGLGVRAYELIKVK
ncbi:MAG: DUF362 domain-containing protein [Christensenellales bacterium]